jgi:hypothetical protein
MHHSMNLKFSAILVAALLGGGQSSAHPVGQPAFSFVCHLGPKAVRVTTEGTDLVYRYGTINAPELTIRGSAASHNVFFHHDTWAHGEGQQLRFVNDAYSYVLSSVFVAPGYDGRGAEDWVKFSVLHDDKVIKTLRCQRSAAFDNFDQLDLLPPDGMRAIAY